MGGGKALWLTTASNSTPAVNTEIDAQNISSGDEKDQSDMHISVDGEKEAFISTLKN